LSGASGAGIFITVNDACRLRIRRQDFDSFSVRPSTHDQWQLVVMIIATAMVRIANNRGCGRRDGTQVRNDGTFSCPFLVLALTANGGIA